jgi:poly-D-alanine transfer protein DltD
MNDFDKKFPNLIGKKCNFEISPEDYYTQGCVEEYCLDKQVVTTEWARFLATASHSTVTKDIQKAALKFMGRLGIKIMEVKE